MEDENKSSRMRGWNGCTHKEGKLWEIDSREGGGGRGCRGGGGDDQGSCNLVSGELVKNQSLFLSKKLNCALQIQLNWEDEIFKWVQT